MAVIRLARPRPLGSQIEDLRGWLAARWEVAWLVPLLGIAAVAHAWNMFDFPYYESDEGTYMSQAWAVFNVGQLAPYTYWYDHPPLGWIQLGVLSILENSIGSFASSIEPGRISMLLYHLGCGVLVFFIARRSGRSLLAASIAVLVFSLSASGLYFQRRVLLDNIATFWLLASFLPLLSRDVGLSRVWLSAGLLGIGILSKEIDIVAIPAIALLVWSTVDPPRRLLATTGWVAITGVATSAWVLLAVLKGELFPTGTLLGGVKPHVSLLETIAYQAARDRDGGLLQPTSAFWEIASSWAIDDPLLIVVGTAAALLAILAIRRHRVPGVIGLVLASLWLFLGRGGVTLRFYVVPLLPLLALELAWLLDLARSSITRPHRRPTATPLASAILACLACAGAALSFRGTALGFAEDSFLLWTGREAAAQRAAIDWVREFVPPQSGMVTDMYPWIDLHAPQPSLPRFDLAHWYWKADRDPEIYDGVFARDWRRVDYLILTPQVYADGADLPFLASTINHADILASFGNGDWPVTIARTRIPKSMNVASDTLLQRQWADWRPPIASSSGGLAKARPDLRSFALLAAVYMDDRTEFDAIWSWTRTNVQAADGRIAAKPATRPGAAPSGLAGPRVDTDTAVALAFAAARWKSDGYRTAATQLIDAIWTHETLAVKDGRLVVPAPRPRAGASTVIADLSAISPHAYRIFASLDRAHDWPSVIDASYRFLLSVQAQKDTGGQVGLVPRWAAISQTSGNAVAVAAPGGGENLFDAYASQVGWRVGLDWLWNRDARAQRVLDGLFLPDRELARKSWLGRAYHLNGQPIDGLNTVATYTTSLPSVLFGGDPELAAGAFTKFVLAPVVAPDAGHIDATDRAWAWFGTALMDGGLVDLTKPADRIDWSTVPAIGR